MTWHDEVSEIERRRKRALGLGGEDRVRRQHDAGRLTVRERLAALLDRDSFVEIGALAGEGDDENFVPAGYVAGLGRIDGREVAVGGEDFTVRGGSERDGRTKVHLLVHMANDFKIPLVLLHDGAGGNIENTIRRGYMQIPTWLNAAGEVGLTATVPVVAGIMGSVAGGPASRAMLSHWSVMPKHSADFFIAGPPVVKRAVGLDITKRELGGSDVQVHVSGTVDNEGDDELDCFRQIREFLSYMPRNVWELPPYREPTDTPDRKEEGLLSIIPRNRRQPYDMRSLIRLVVDDGVMFELKPFYGKCVITCFARLNGHVVGVLANNPMFQGGALDGPGADKQVRFMELCDQFHIPIIYFVDVPGFMVGPDAERSGALRRGMRAFWMTYSITVPLLQVIVRRCYGVGSATTSRTDRMNLRIAWPSAEFGGIPIEGGVDAAFRRVIQEAPDPDAKRAEIEETITKLRSPFLTAEALGVEDVFDPRETRPTLIRLLETAQAVSAYDLGPKSRPGVRP
jgi:acetyl-CoA carboxylase carboxyltransferase component